MKILKVLFLMVMLFKGSAQNCTLSIDGHLFDTASEEPLEFANIFLEESNQGVSSDAKGYFKIENVCPGDFHVRVSHIGCESSRIFITISKDTSLHIHLDHSSELLDEVMVHGHDEDHSSNASSTIGEKQISESANENLADLLSNISGVSTLSNGAGISKPVVHGLFGNRITILNNGIAQAGQQWGCLLYTSPSPRD